LGDTCSRLTGEPSVNDRDGGASVNKAGNGRGRGRGKHQKKGRMGEGEVMVTAMIGEVLENLPIIGTLVVLGEVLLFPLLGLPQVLLTTSSSFLFLVLGLSPAL
jgi:hypothetical protein